MDRSLSVFDLTDLKLNGQWNAPLMATLDTVANEKLTLEVLTGKQLFYDAADDRLARDNYMSCASCHNEGHSDGRVWDLTGMGEGLRNTITLNGRSSTHGPLHWTQNFDEVQDFEGQIRQLAGGTGLMANADFFGWHTLATAGRSESRHQRGSRRAGRLRAVAGYLCHQSVPQQ